MKAGELLAWCFEHKLISGVDPRRQTGRPRGVRTADRDERWNLIFEEKFADPSYYSATRVRMQSPLAGF